MRPVIQTIRLTPANGDAPRVFEVIDIDYNTQTRQLTLTCRDGRICVELLGEWQMTIAPSTRAFAHTIEDAERIHDGRTLVVLAH